MNTFCVVLAVSVGCILLIGPGSGNELCNKCDWSLIKGEWSYDVNDCTIENTNSASGNIVWFGSSDGVTPDSGDYDFESFILEVEYSITSGSGDAGLLFRAGSVSGTNDGGQQYYIGMYPTSNEIEFGRMNNGWSSLHVETLTVDYDVIYTLKVVAQGSYYNVYVDESLVFQDLLRSEYGTGSIGVRTYNAPAVYYSVTLTSLDDLVENDTGYYIGVYTGDDVHLSWYDALTYCQESVGTSLASIHSSTDNSNAISAAGGICASTTPPFWIGFNDITNENSFEWSDGSVVDYSNWNSGEPNDASGEDCTLMRTAANWNDIECNSASWLDCFVCNK